MTIRAIEECPSIIRLLDAPRSTYPAADIREALREQLVALFLARKPRMSPIRAHRYAEITVQMLRALLWLYLDIEPPEREVLVAEIKSALVHAALIFCRRPGAPDVDARMSEMASTNS